MIEPIEFDEVSDEEIDRTGRGKFWEPDIFRAQKAIAKRHRRRFRNMRNAVAQGTHVKVVVSGTPELPGRVELRPVD